MSSVIPRYIVAGCRPWNRRLFDEELAGLPGRWEFAGDTAALNALLIAGDSPRFIFFIHWSQRVPDEWLEKFECVCFHMTDVPYGRGGSPLQNLIVRGHQETKLTALRMVHEMDAGPVYAQEPLSLEGSAEQIYLRAGRLSARMIKQLVKDEPAPVPQSGEAVIFKRRTPAQSRMPDDLAGLHSLHDFVRMLDAEGYPHAFIEHGKFRFEFTRSTLHDGRVQADVRITPINNLPT